MEVKKETAIFINGLRLYAYHGVMPQERRVGGWFLVTLRVHYNITRAMESDRVADTLSYADLCELVKREMAIPSSLLEHVAGRIARAIVEHYPEAEGLELEITKENPPLGCNCQGAGVRLVVTN
ncbi:MAG: dihydroneopterin aldolase [Prevotella sp.]|nr:dihydroneopterin aldolase [Prevotella sp.]